MGDAVFHIVVVCEGCFCVDDFVVDEGESKNVFGCGFDDVNFAEGTSKKVVMIVKSPFVPGGEVGECDIHLLAFRCCVSVYQGEWLFVNCFTGVGDAEILCFVWAVVFFGVGVYDGLYIVCSVWRWSVWAGLRRLMGRV